jgi:hypothetical protein
MNQEEAFEAAKLAAMVGGQLKSIDKHFIERKNIPANRIDINSFIDQVKDPIHHKTRMASYLANTPQGFAPPPPEDYIQSQVPDIQQVRPETQPSVTPPPIQNSPTHVHTPAQEPLPMLQTVTNIPQPIQQEKSNISPKTEKEFLKTLKSIDKTLSDMLAYMKENHFR